ncbi:alpha/beta hydrolase [Nonomuraea sp. NPDC050536]|uniref:alpha/beta hydrolase n=1 Tax=Nonomuraea sp. NPDC050536 TaxID=3364366 RepID=UPI0037C9A60D
MRVLQHWFACAVAGALLVAGTVLVPAPAAQAETCSTTLSDPTDFGITCLRVDRHPQADGSELRDITMTSTAIFQASGGTPVINPLTRTITVRVYLPSGYDPARSARYRSLYLINGGGDDYDEWTTKADLVSLIAKVPGHPYDGIVVMPTGGMSGWYADWAGHTDGFFAPRWETYHISQLIPWIDANFHTIADRSGRGLAGISMGGYGTLRYAAAHPDVFSVIGAFSPGIDVRAKPAQGTVSDSMWQAGASIAPLDLLNGKFRVNKYDANGVLVIDQDQQRLYRLDTLFGPHTTGVVDGRTVYDWPSANPATLVTQGKYAPYSGRLGLYAGGCATLAQPGDGNHPAPPECGYSTTSPANTDATSVNEPILGSYASVFDATLTSLGVGHRYCYSTGGHDWKSWPAYLTDFLQYAYGTAPARCPGV